MHSLNTPAAWACRWHWSDAIILCSFVIRASPICLQSPRPRRVRCVDWNAPRMSATWSIPNGGISPWHLRSCRLRSKLADTLDLGTVAQRWWPARMDAVRVCRWVRAIAHRRMRGGRHRRLWHRRSQLLCTDRIQRWTNRPISRGPDKKRKILLSNASFWCCVSCCNGWNINDKCLALHDDEYAQFGKINDPKIQKASHSRPW